MSHLQGLKELKNKYFILRHGQSTANVAGIILSGLEEGIKDKHTLTSEGENQVRLSVSEAKADGMLDENTVIYSSPFSRCKRTAEVAREVLGVKSEIIFDDRLRERWFGDWEKTDNSNYQKTWDIDKQDPTHKEKNVESALDVQKRATELVKEIENIHSQKNILLVSHGDTLQILQTGFKKVSPSEHRDLQHLQVAEVRKLNLE
jgi:glucosyl-3-phosphoglycerate phosphatase